MRQQLRSFRHLAPLVTAALLLHSSDPVQAQLIVAHRGASEDAPENTLSAFELAWKQGADAIEGDFYLTSDGHIVTIHDDDTKRTAGVERKVAKSTLRQLRQLDVGTWKSPKFKGERIPTIQEVLATVPRNKAILIEIKCGPEIVPKLKQVLDASTLKPDQTIVIAFDESVVKAVKEQIPDIKAYWLTGYKQDKETGAWSPTLGEVLAALKRTGADGVDTKAEKAVVNARFIRAIRQSGYEVHTWTIDDPKEARHFQELGVDSITTNVPGALRKVLSRRTGEDTGQ
jgi:glycerophosphoryl diester phosphodiesterase